MDRCEKGQSHAAEIETKEYLPGYAELAAYISVDPDCQIYRRFDRLAARNLLYLQSELATLEQWFDDHDRMEVERKSQASTGEKVGIIMRNASWNVSVALGKAGKSPAANEEEKREAEKLEKIERLRVVTAQYQDALIRQNKCLAIGQPGKRALGEFRKWLVKKKGSLTGPQDRAMLEKEEELVCLKSSSNQDRLSRFLRENVGFAFGYFHAKEHHYPKSWGAIYKFREEEVERFSAFISVLMAAALLVGSIAVLYFVSQPGVKLALLAGFVFVFGITTGLLSSCRRTELFAATAGYTAVLVVFISGDFTRRS